MEVDKIAINDNFSSENQKNTPHVNSVNERDVHTFRKQLSDKNKSDSIIENLSEESEEFVQDFGSLFCKLKLSDEKEQSQNQQDSNASNNEQSSSTLLKKEKEKVLPKKPFIKDSVKEDVSISKTFARDFTKEGVLPNKSFDKGSVKGDISTSKVSSRDFIREGVSTSKTSVRDFSEEALSKKPFIEDSVKNDVPINKAFIEGGLDTVELSPITGIATTTNAQNTDFSTNIRSKSTLSTIQTPSISQQIKDQVIDRILVSTASLNANQSVKVVFSPTVLAETEVNIQKLGQTLQVQFVSSDVKSIAFIQSNQLDLQGYLQSNLKKFEEIQVSLKEMDNDLDQPKDGRSRNRNESQSFEDDEDEQ